MTSNPLTSNEVQMQVLGKIEAEFTSFHFLHIKNYSSLRRNAYTLLMDEAVREYGQYGIDVLDVKNISMKGSLNGVYTRYNAFVKFILGITLIVADTQDIHCTGTVILNTNKIKTTVESLNHTAIVKSFDTLNQFIPNGSKIAILAITPNNDDSIYISEELMIQFFNSGKYLIVERDTLEVIRQEQLLQMSGEVSDDSAVSIGQFIGADVVITGTISGNGNQRRLRLKALSVKTAQILAISSEGI
jgi:hypothetical protein